MAKIKLVLAWLASHYAGLVALFPLYFSKSWYFKNHQYAIGLRIDTTRKLRLILTGEWSPANKYFDLCFAVGPLYVDFTSVVEF